MQVQSQRFGIHRTLAAFEDGAIVGTAGDWEMELTLPGRTRVAAPGVTAVGVLPTRRRRGILTSMMRRQLDDIRGRGEVVATLLAAESVIYGRFGYGWATTSMAAELDTARAELSWPVDPGVKLRLLDKADAVKTLASAY